MHRLLQAVLRINFWLIWPVFFMALPVFAKTQLNISIGQNAKPVRNQILRQGNIKVSVTYDPTVDENLLRYSIFYNDVALVRQEETTRIVGQIVLGDLDGDRIAEVIVGTFSGGAHCCKNYTIYSWQQGRFHKTATGSIDGVPSIDASFADIDGDGKVEYVEKDNRFNYAFSSYAGSYPPDRVFQLRRGQLVEATRNYPDFLRQRLESMRSLL